MTSYRQTLFYYIFYVWTSKLKLYKWDSVKICTLDRIGIIIIYSYIYDGVLSFTNGKIYTDNKLPLVKLQ